MQLNIKVITNAKKIEVRPTGPNSFLVKIKTKPIAGAANQAVISALSSFLKISPRRLKIIRGVRSRLKVINLE